MTLLEDEIWREPDRPDLVQGRHDRPSAAARYQLGGE